MEQLFRAGLNPKSWVSNCCWESMCRQQMTAARLLQAISFNCGKKSSSCLSMKMLSRCFSAQWFWFFRIFDLHPCKRTLRIPKKRFRACRRFAVWGLGCAKWHLVVFHIQSCIWETLVRRTRCSVTPSRSWRQQRFLLWLLGIDTYSVLPIAIFPLQNRTYALSV